MTMDVQENFTAGTSVDTNFTVGGGVHQNLTRTVSPVTNVIGVNVEHFCAFYSHLSLVVTIPLSFVVASILCGNVVLIFYSCRSQQPNSKPVHLPTVCFASGNLLNVLILMYFQLYVTVSGSYSCEIVHIMDQFQILVVTVFSLHLLAAAVRFSLVTFKPSYELRDNVPSPHVRTTLVVIWFQASGHCICVLINLFFFTRLPNRLNLVMFCLILAVPVLALVLFVISQATKHYRKMRRYRDWTGERFAFRPVSKDCIVFKWALMTACTLLLFWLPFWTKNVYDYFRDPTSHLEAFDFYTWIVVDILLLSNSLLIHLI